MNCRCQAVGVIFWMVKVMESLVRSGGGGHGGAADLFESPRGAGFADGGEGPILEEAFAQRLGAGVPGGGQPVACWVFCRQPLVPEFLQVGRVGVGNVREGLFAAPEKEGVLVVDFDHADGGFVGIRVVGVGVDVCEKVLGVLFLGVDERGIEEVDDLVEAGEFSGTGRLHLGVGA